MDYEFLNNFETTLQQNLLKLCTDRGVLEGVLLESADIEQRWHDFAPEYMVDAVKEIAQYPSVALVWAAYLGMGVANGWHTDWERCSNAVYTDFYGAQGFDDMDDNIIFNIIGFTQGSTEANNLKDTMRVIADYTLSQIHHCGIEPQSVMAFHTFARACKVLFRIGAALELNRLGYEYKAVTLN